MFSCISTPAPGAEMELANAFQVKSSSGNLTGTREFTKSGREMVAESTAQMKKRGRGGEPH